MQTRHRSFVELVVSVQAGDTGAFSELMLVLKPTVDYSVAQFRRLARDGWLADDLRQEAWLAVWKAAGKYDTVQFSRPDRAFFARAIRSRLSRIEESSSPVRINRPLARFLKNAALGNVNLDCTDTEVIEAHPGISTQDASLARNGGRAWLAVRDTALQGLSESLCPSGEGWTAQLGQARDTEAENLETRLDLLGFLKAFLGGLSDFQQKVFSLRFLEEATRVETALELSRSTDTVRRVELVILSKCAAAWNAYQDRSNESERRVG